MTVKRFDKVVNRFCRDFPVMGVCLIFIMRLTGRPGMSVRNFPVPGAYALVFDAGSGILI